MYQYFDCKTYEFICRATVRLGEYDERTDPDCEGSLCADPVQDFIPLVIIAHRNYNVPKYKNDIGLIRLDREAVITRSYFILYLVVYVMRFLIISAYVSPICLPYKNMDSINYTGLEAVAAGWGTVNVGKKSKNFNYLFNLIQRLLILFLRQI